MKILIILFALVILFSVVSINPAFAVGEIGWSGYINSIGEVDKYQFTVSGANSTTRITATLLCLNSGGLIEPLSKTLDPVLTVKSPSGLIKFDDDSFSPCKTYNSSIILFKAGEVNNGIWEASAAGYQGLGEETGPYKLTVYLYGPGSIKRGGINVPPAEKETAVKVFLAMHIYQEIEESNPLGFINDLKSYHGLAVCLVKNVGCLAEIPGFIFEAAFADAKNHYYKIAHDPPRNDFMYKFILPPPSNVQPRGDSEAEIQYAELINAVSDSGPLLDAYITSIERFQGAMEAGESEYALTQAYEVENFLNLLTANQNRVKIASESLRNILINNESQINANIAAYQQLLLSNGFSADEIEVLQNTGFNSEEIDALKTKLLELNSQDIANQIVSLGEFSTGLDEFVTVTEDRSLDLDTFTEDVFPPETIPAELTDDPFFCDSPLSTYAIILHGTDANDYLLGTPNNDLIIGGDGNDKLFGKGGNDCIFGGEGNDYLVGGSGDDKIHGENGDDKIWGQSGYDLLYGGFGSDRLAGGTDNDFVFGDEDNDFLWGQIGDDALDGGTETDRCYDHIGIDTTSNCE